jgi:sugar lactone lactonase YvrE
MPGDQRRSIPALLLCALLLSACTSAAATKVSPHASASASPRPSVHPPQATSTAALATVVPGDTTPTRYVMHVLLHGSSRPDDLAFDEQGHLLFSDAHNGTVSRLNGDGSVTVLARGLASPEGLAVLHDGTIIIAEQRTNRLLALAPGAQMPAVLRTLPGTPSSAPCKDGLDGIALDPAGTALIVPDSPTGALYRLSLDGRTLHLLADGLGRPVGAAVDAAGNIYVADECGHAVWRIAPGGQKTRLGGFGMPDDVAVDRHGNLLVIDLDPRIHALLRLRLATGKRETLASKGLIEPQGLVVDRQDHIFVADDYANMIVELTPV